MKIRNKRKLITSIILVITIVSLLIVNHKVSETSLAEQSQKEATSNTPTTFEMRVADFYGNDITTQTNSLSNTKTSQLKLYSLTEAQYNEWLMENYYSIYNVGPEVEDRTTDEVKTLQAGFIQLQQVYISNKSTSGVALYGETKDVNSIFSGNQLQEGKYYAIYNNDYNYSWKVEGLSDYKALGSTLYFKYQNGAKITAIYYDYNESNYTASAVINTNTDEYNVPARTFENLAYIIKDESGNYVLFDNINSHLIYKGKSTEKNVITNLTGKTTIHNLPNGKYYVTQVTESDRYQEENVTKELVVNNTSTSSVTYTNIYNDTRIVIIQNYTDSNGPKSTKLYNIKTGNSNNPNAYFVYKGLDKEGNRIYDYTPTKISGATDTIEVDYKTTIYHIPSGMVYTLQLFNEFGGEIRFSYYQSLQLGIYGNFYLKSQVYDNTYGMKKYTKTNVDGTEKIDAKFYIKTTGDYKYVFNKHEKLTYDGKEYKNVYEIVGVVPLSQETEQSIIEAKDGEFYVYYPLKFITFHLPPSIQYGGTYKYYQSYGTCLSLYELATENDYILNDNELDYFFPDYLRLSGTYYDYNGRSPYQEIEITTNYEELKETNNADVNIVNLHTPSITKEIKNDNSTFKFDLYEGELEEIKLNSTMIESPNYPDTKPNGKEWEFEVENANYYIVEFTKDSKMSYSSTNRIEIYDEDNSLIKTLDSISYSSDYLPIKIASSKIKIIYISDNLTSTKFQATVTSYNRHGINYEKIKEIEVNANETVYLEQLLTNTAGKTVGYLKENTPYLIKEQLSEEYEQTNIIGKNGAISIDEEGNNQFEFIFNLEKEVSVTFTNNKLKNDEPEVEEPEVPINPSTPNANTADYIITFIVLNLAALVVFTTGTIVLLKKKGRYNKIG